MYSYLVKAVSETHTCPCPPLSGVHASVRYPPLSGVRVCPCIVCLRPTPYPTYYYISEVKLMNIYSPICDVLTTEHDLYDVIT